MPEKASIIKKRNKYICYATEHSPFSNGYADRYP